MSNYLLSLDVIFQEALRDIESLGVQISKQLIKGSKPYAVITGRSNARWWLIPLENRKVTVSGLALFQPILRKARALKCSATIVSKLGLNCIWARNKVYISGESVLFNYFSKSTPLTCSYFTGTSSPHRKVTVQIMDSQGVIKGYAKFSRDLQVQKLIEHEAKTLNRLQQLDLDHAFVPNVIYHGKIDKDLRLLVTDTLKTPDITSTSQFNNAHRLFLHELKQKTSEPELKCVSDFGNEYRNRLTNTRSILDAEWIERIERSISLLESHECIRIPICLTHGDFTPWNTFVIQNKLYVFDWEYAQQAYPISNDIIHFYFNKLNVGQIKMKDFKDEIIKVLNESWTGLKSEHFRLLLTIYILNQTLHKIEIIQNKKQYSLWEGYEKYIHIFDNYVL